MIAHSTVVIPGFTLENRKYGGLIGLKDMRETLARLGFDIKSIFDTENQQLIPEVSNPPPNLVLFEVTLPVGWSLVDGYDGYGLQDPEIKHLLDARNQFRAHLHYDSRDPVDAEFYCRYSLDPHNGFYNERLVGVHVGYLVDVVVDRAVVDHKQPHTFPKVVHHDLRKASSVPFTAANAIRALVEFEQREAQRKKEGLPPFELPIETWMNARYPDWRDPFAYW